MTKLDVGVGEDFPVADEPGNKPENHEETTCCGHGGRHQAWQQMRDQWLARHRAFHDRLHGRDAGDVVAALRAHHVHHLVLGALVLIGLAALIGFRRHD
jgi:hypothetical protein